MNRLNLSGILPAVMFPCLVFLFLFSPLLSGQGFRPHADSLRSDSLPTVPFLTLSMGSCGTFLVPPTEPFLLLRDSAAFAELMESKRFIGQCRDLELPQIDYARNTVLGFEMFIDCNADVAITLLRDTAAQGYRVVLDESYGGCRSMRRNSYWLLIPALKEGESVVIEKRRHEEQW